MKTIPERLRNLRALLDHATQTFWQNKAFFNVGGDGYTYQDLGKKVEETAKMLASYGIQPGDRVGLVGQNSPNSIPTIFASDKPVTFVIISSAILIPYLLSNSS